MTIAVDMGRKATKTKQILKSCTVLVVVDKIFIVIIYYPLVQKIKKKRLKETKSTTMNIFRKQIFSFKSFVKVKLSYIFQ